MEKVHIAPAANICRAFSIAFKIENPIIYFYYWNAISPQSSTDLHLSNINWKQNRNELIGSED